MKKRILGLTCALSAATCFLFACDKAPDISDVKWSNAGITAETLTLPELELDSVKNTSGRDGTSITVVWNGATEENYNALASECYTKIPANTSLFGEQATLEELKNDQTFYSVFTAKYTVSEEDYTCIVMYFKSVYSKGDAEYDKDQLVLNIEKETVNHMVHEYWDGIINDNKTWFNEDELAILGWDGVAAPQGDIMGKISDVDRDGLQIALENTTKDVFDGFVKELYDGHIKNYGEFGDREYNDANFYHVDNSPETASVSFTVRYDVGEKSISLFVVYRNAHIVVQASVYDLD